MKILLQLTLAAALSFSGRAATITNGGFESGLGGWRQLWTRDAQAGTAALDTQTFHDGRTALRIEHRGGKDWSVEPAVRVPVEPGDLFELEAWLRVESRGGSATLCVSTHDAAGQAQDWAYGARTVSESSGWQRLRTRFVVPPGVATLQPRLIGDGPASVWLDDYSFEKKSNVNALRPPGLPPVLSLSNAALVVSLETRHAALTVLDRRTGRTVAQQPLSAEMVVTGATLGENQIRVSLLQAASGLELAGVIRLEAGAPEFTFELSGQGELSVPLRFPYPFASEPGQNLIVPMNEGISYPVDDPTIPPLHLVAYGGHGICMAFWGVTDGVSGHGVIIETPDDASIRILRAAGRLAIAPQWDAQRGQFGYARRLRYVFFEQGGHVAVAKRYRAHARQAGLLKTLEEKRRENPNVDLLVGAVNVWCWDRDAVSLVRDMQSAGVARILWSNGQPPQNLRTLNELGVLTSRYDIYQDVMDPANFKFLSGVHGDWTTAAWPNDIILNARGQWMHGWGVKGKDGQWYDCGVICDRRAPAYAAQRIPAELATHPYRCRFIDTTTAAPWHECYSPVHPMTRTQSREWKMKLLEYVSRDCKLVTGCETGHDASVPFLHYFEGMLSLGPYRVPDSGRDMARIWTNAPEAVVKFQLGHAYRLPLWELVYHDCVVAQWYWGDYNNKLPMLWDKRDLFNLLYGTPPMFMFNRALWEREKARFVQSYQTTCPAVRRVGYAEMTDHRWLTPDRSVQQTSFANGVTVAVNFGDKPYPMPAGPSLAPMGFRVTPDRE
jgi:hypothetical protein